MKKKMIMLFAAMSAVLALAIGGTLAFLQATTEVVTNTMTVGDVDGEVIEPDWDPEKEKVMEPGAEVDKNPMVISTGRNSAFVRMIVTGDLNYLSFDQDNITTDFGAWRANAANGAPWYFAQDDQGNWHYYYYRALDPGTGPNFDALTNAYTRTEPLFNVMWLNPLTVTEDLSGVDLSLNVSAELIQANGLGDGVNNAVDAFGLWRP